MHSLCPVSFICDCSLAPTSFISRHLAYIKVKIDVAVEFKGRGKYGSLSISVSTLLSSDCMDGWPLLFVLPQAQQSLPLLSCMLVKAYRVRVWGVSGWSTGSGHVPACGKHWAPRGPKTRFRMQHSTDAHNLWGVLCFSCLSDSRLKWQHLFQQALVNKLFYMQTNCSFWL